MRFPAMDMDDAYAIQDTWVAAKMRSDDRVMGWKIGLTSQAMQSALSIDTPDSGVLFESMAFDNGAVLPAHTFTPPPLRADPTIVTKRPPKSPTLPDYATVKTTTPTFPSYE